MFQSLRNTLILEFVLAALAVTSEVTSAAATARFSNVTSASLTSATSPTASACCFVIQETVNDVWAQIYWTSTWHQVVNKTIITAHVTPYPDTTITNYETHVYTTNGTFSTPEPWGQNPLQNFAFNAPGPTETASMYNMSQTIVAGRTIHSPQAAYIYTKVKIITAEPVTDSGGNLACATPWSYPTELLFWQGNSTTLSSYGAATPGQTVEVFPSINSNAQAYWGSDIAGLSQKLGPPVTTTGTFGYLKSSGSVTSTSIGTYTITSPAYIDHFWVNSQLQSVDTDTVKQVGVTITFDQPYIYEPATAALGTTGLGRTGCRSGPGTEGYGYPPQTLIDYMVQDPAISRQYPGLENCIPAGPSMLRPTDCSLVAPGFQEVASDLTETLVITVTPQPAAAASEHLPVTNAIPTSAKNAVPTSISPPKSPETSKAPTQSPPLTVPVPTATIQVSPSPTAETGTEVDSSSAAGIASFIASIIGANPSQPPPVIEGTTQIVVSVETTIPYNPAAPVSGMTIVNGGSTQVVVSSVETVPLSQALGSLPGSTVLVSGTLEAIIGATTIPVNSKLPGLTGSTTMISGTVYVVVSSPTTVPVVLSNPTAGLFRGGSNDTTTTPIQVSIGASSSTFWRRGHLLILMSFATLSLV